MEQTLKNGLAAELTKHATGMLNAAQRLLGVAPAMHNNAEFQALEMSLTEYAASLVKFKRAFAPYEVQS